MAITTPIEQKNEIRVGDLGTEFIIIVVDYDTLDQNGDPTVVDISTATIKTITFLKPDGSRVDKTAEFTLPDSGGAGDGSDGQLSYFTVDGDLDLKGTYKLQGAITTPKGFWRTTIGKFKAEDNL